MSVFPMPFRSSSPRRSGRLAVWAGLAWADAAAGLAGAALVAVFGARLLAAGAGALRTELASR